MRLLHLRRQIMGLDRMYSSAGGYGPCRSVPLLQTIGMTNGNEFAWMGEHPPTRVGDINPHMMQMTRCNHYPVRKEKRTYLETYTCVDPFQPGTNSKGFRGWHGEPWTDVQFVSPSILGLYGL